MKQAFLLIVLFLLVQSTRAQAVYFMAIDADNGQPFSVIIGKKNYSSDSRGHLVIPNLKDSAYELAVNFPRQQFPEQFFSVAVAQKDRGFQLKKTGEQQWALYDWRTLELIQPGKLKQEEVLPVAAKRNDAFAQLMAGVVNDTAVLYKQTAAIVKKEKEKEAAPAKEIRKEQEKEVVAVKDPVVVKSQDTTAAHPVQQEKPVVVTEKKQPDTVLSKTEAKKDTISIAAKLPEKPKPPVVVAVKEKPVPKPPVKTPVAAVQPGVRKLFDNTGKEWRDIKYRDSSATGIDTITIKIPLSGNPLENAVPPPAPPEKQAEKPAPDTVQQAGKPAVLQVKIDSVPPQELLMEVKPVQKDSTNYEPPPPAVDTVYRKPVVMINSDCRNQATDADLDKLRVKLLAETTVESRIEAAKKVFKTKCFTTRQIRALTELFYTDESRYKFFDAAYPHVSDTESFKGLAELLSDAYYVGRFRAMVRL